MGVSLRIRPWRRAVQAAVLFGVLAAPVVARYGHYLSARYYEKIESQWGGRSIVLPLRAAEAVLGAGLRWEEGGVPGRRPRKALIARARWFYGSAWSARLFGVSLTELLAGAESAAASRGLRWTLLAGLVAPLALSVLLGRVYCSWVCPMGLLSALARRLRSLLVYLELEPLSLELARSDKYVVLGLGLLFALLTGLPLLHHLYPPAIVGRESHALFSAWFDRAEEDLYGVPWNALGGGALFLGVVLLIEAAVAPGFWCRSLCPGGALYSLLGRFRVLRVKRQAAACIDCGRCDYACPMALKPMSDRTGMECDNCGDCIDVCPTPSLSFKVTLSAALLLFLFAAPEASAHHILGIPHYTYDRDFPQAPVLKLVEKVGEWQVQLTGFPGNPRPGEKSEISVYASQPGTERAYAEPLRLEAAQLRPLGGARTFYGPEPSRLIGNLHHFTVTFPEDGNYELTLHLTAGGVPSTLRFALVVGEPGNPWATLGAASAAFVTLLVGVRAARIKRARRQGAAA